MIIEKKLSLLWEKGELLKGIFEKTFFDRIYPLGEQVFMLGRYKEGKVKISLDSFFEKTERALVKIFEKGINITFEKYLYLVKNTERSDYSALRKRVCNLKNNFERLLISIMEMGISLGLSRRNMVDYCGIALGNFEYNSGFCCVNNFNEFSSFVRNGYGCYGDKLWDEF